MEDKLHGKHHKNFLLEYSLQKVTITYDIIMYNIFKFLYVSHVRKVFQNFPQNYRSHDRK